MGARGRIPSKFMTEFSSVQLLTIERPTYVRIFSLKCRLCSNQIVKPSAQAPLEKKENKKKTFVHFHFVCKYKVAAYCTYFVI